MASFTKRVGASADDGYNPTGSWNYTDWVLSFGVGASGAITNAIRFLNVTIPQGSTINSATLQVTPDVSDTSNVNTKIYGIDEDNTSDFSSDPTGRTKTTANTDWNFTDTTQDLAVTSPSITSIVQEIVNRAGWGNGNAMGFLILDNGTPTQAPDDRFNTFYSYDASTTKAAYLQIDYTLPGTTTSTTTTSTTTTSTSTTSTSTTTTSTSTTTTSTSTTSTSTSTTTLAPEREIYGIKVLKPNISGTSNDNIVNLKDYYLNSKKVLLKIHKQGSFKATFMGKGAAGGSITDVTINFPELKSRSLVLVYMQRMTHAPAIDTDYHLLDWSYFGATQAGEHYVKVYNNKIIITYYDEDMSLDAQGVTSLYGYYYIFEEEV